MLRWSKDCTRSDLFNEFWGLSKQSETEIGEIKIKLRGNPSLWDLHGKINKRKDEIEIDKKTRLQIKSENNHEATMNDMWGS